MPHAIVNQIVFPSKLKNRQTVISAARPSHRISLAAHLISLTPQKNQLNLLPQLSPLLTISWRVIVLLETHRSLSASGRVINSDATIICGLAHERVYSVRISNSSYEFLRHPNNDQLNWNILIPILSVLLSHQNTIENTAKMV